MATIEEITERMRERFATSDFDSKIKFDFGGDGLIHVDGSRRPPAVSNADAEADCTIKIALADFLDLVKGELNPTTAFMMGKLKVDGSMAVALKLAGILG